MHTDKVLLHCRSKNEVNPLAIVQIKDNWTNLLKSLSTQPTRSLWVQPHAEVRFVAAPFLLVLLFLWHCSSSRQTQAHQLWSCQPFPCADVDMGLAETGALDEYQGMYKWHTLHNCVLCWARGSFFEDRQMPLDLDCLLSLTTNKVPVCLPNQRDRYCSSLLFLRLEEGKEIKPWELVNVCKILL